MAGRKTKYTPDMLPKILEIYDNGDTDSDVCAILGISRDTFYRWYKTKKAFSDEKMLWINTLVKF